MYNSILISTKQVNLEKYSQTFNLFHSEVVNNYIASSKIQFVIHFRDLQMFDDRTQYFKRYYSMHETISRTCKLISYYELNMAPPSPNIIPVQNYKLIENNHRKHLKLFVMQGNSQRMRKERKEEQIEEEYSGQMILSRMDDSDFQEVSNEKNEQNERNSYDSSPFNTYEIDKQDARQIQILSTRIKNFDFISIQQIPNSLLVLDFKDAVKKHPTSNIQLSMNLPNNFPKIHAVQTGVQTVSTEFLQYFKVVQKQIIPKKVMIPETKEYQQFKAEFGLQQRSNLNNKDIVQQNQIEKVQTNQLRKKPKQSTFMQYYNSQPIKAPSNILQRYINRNK